MRERRRCEGIIVERSFGHLPYWKRCTANALHGDYCTQCFQRRVQNDSARAALVPGWEKILVGDESRKGRGKVRIALEGPDKEAADAILRREREENQQQRVQVGPGAPPIPAGPTEPVLLDRGIRMARVPPVVTVKGPPAPEPPDDIFAAARRTLAALTKI